MSDSIESLRRELDELRRELARHGHGRGCMRAAKSPLNRVALVIVGLLAATWVLAQTSGRTLEQRVTDIEKRIVSFPAERPASGRAATPQTVSAPFKVVDKAGRLLVEISENARGASIGIMGANQIGQVVTLAASGDGGYLSVSSGGREASVGAREDWAGLLINGSEGRAAFVGAEDEQGDGGVIRVYSSEGKAVGAFTGTEEGLGGRISLSGPESAGDRVVFSADEKGGKVRVLDSAGKPVVGLLADAAGGRVIVASAANGKTVASMASAQAGGTLRVFPASGGKVRGELVVDGAGGGLHLWDAAGEEVLVNLTSNGLDGTGRLEIGNGKGDIVVSAGATYSKKLGFVSTGPYDGGVAGTMGGGLRAASSLLGKESE